MYEDILNNSISGLSAYFGISSTATKTILIIGLIWIILWKGLALWKAGRLNHPIWFIVILLTNTFGILEILYIFAFSKIDLDESGKKSKRKKRKNAA